jgi:glucose-1-phosphate cytidylyltransferase
MINIGYRPILWNVMKYYAHHGHKDFILCLGYKADYIKNYFLNYNEAISNDFTLSGGGRGMRLLNSDIDDWNITFVDTGMHSTIGERLRLVRRHLDGEEMFLANYGDVLTDAPLDRLISRFQASGKTAAFLAVRPTYTFHVVDMLDDGLVKKVTDVSVADIWLNGGYLMLRPEIFDDLHPGDELVQQPFQRLIEREQLLAMRYEGFWAPLDTLKDMQHLEQLYASGEPPWALWQKAAALSLPR